MKKRVLSPVGVKRVRIGRKAIACGRMLSAIESRSGTSPSSPKKRGFSLPSYRPTRLHAVIAAVVIVVGLAGAGGYTMYSNYQTEQKAVAEKARLEKERIAAEKAASCREKLVAQKADLVGKATYSELYGTTCNQ